MASLLRRFRRISLRLWILLLLMAWTTTAIAADWSEPARQLARKISAKTGPGAIAISFQNPSSLTSSEATAVRRAIEQALRAAGLRFVPAEQAAGTVRVTLAESAQGYLWVAEIHQGNGDDALAMVQVARAEAGAPPRVAASVAVRRQALWSQAEPILDAALLDAGSSTPHLLVLGPERVTLLRSNGGRWEREQEFPIEHARPWPRDVRGRLAPRKDHLFDAFLPGVTCASSARPPLTMSCRASDEPWPLAVADQPPQYVFYGAQRNFFNGALRPGFGETRNTAAFYSAAGLPRPNYTLWLFAGVDGSMRVTDGVNERVIAPRGWGSDVAVILNGCGGPQAVVTAAGDASQADSVAALDVPEREPTVVSQPVEFPGPVTALWSAGDGNSALAVSKNLKTGQYEAYALTLACGP